MLTGMHIPHDHHEVMSSKSEIYMMPIMLKNEASYADCIQIMDLYVASVNRWYAKAGRGKPMGIEALLVRPS